MPTAVGCFCYKEKIVIERLERSQSACIIEVERFKEVCLADDVLYTALNHHVVSRGQTAFLLYLDLMQKEKSGLATRDWSPCTLLEVTSLITIARSVIKPSLWYLCKSFNLRLHRLAAYRQLVHQLDS